MSDHNHWQIFVQFKSPKVAWNVVKLLGCSEKVHVSARYGAATEAAAYCLKPDAQLNSKPVEHGALAQGRGAGAGFRSDIKKLKDRIRDSKDWKGVLNDTELALTSKNHMRFVKEVWRTRPVPRIVWPAAANEWARRREARKPWHFPLRVYGQTKLEHE